jgi:hypothetical protein
MPASDNRSRLSRRKKGFFTVILVIGIGLLGFVVVETYVRVTRSHVDLFGMTGRRVGPNPMKQWAAVDGFCAYRPRAGRYSKGKSVNSHGFLSTPELHVKKPQDTVRIVFLGGSSTAGTGRNLPDEETWPWKVWTTLRHNDHANTVEFINAAVGGYSSFESFGRLWSRIRFFDPDIIVVYHGWNEMYYFNRIDNITAWRTLPDGSWTLDRTSQPVAVYQPLWIDHIIRPSQALTKVRLRLSTPRDGELGTASTELATTFDQRGLEVWRTNLRLFREAASILNAKLFVVKQATLIVPDLSDSDRARCRYGYHGFDHDAHIRAFDDIYHIIDEEISADSIIDCTEHSGRSEYFYDHVHLSPAGTTAIAATIAEYIDTYITQEP